ncbi:MAG TPA: Na-translocating system protein MpsC family protein, partial [Solirubrobacterales bacterium]|nr:Na-translocating system protein MpsC family protein [Solirubrobacterales bacterium]
GPTRARTTIAEDMVVTVLEDSLTKGERTLAAQDQADAVRELRRGLQAAMSSEMTKLVEVVLRREVICFLSDHSPNPDFAVEVLLLAPRPGADGTGDEVSSSSSRFQP